MLLLLVSISRVWSRLTHLVKAGKSRQVCQLLVGNDTVPLSVWRGGGICALSSAV